MESHESTIETRTKKVHSLEIIKLEMESAIKTLENHLDFESKTRHKEMD